MRLLNIHSLSFESFPGDRPPYLAISHRWSENEASYKDVLKKRNTNSFGYWKIVNLCAFAKEWAGPQGVNHLWIDTCCIDQKSSTELSESINSMWKWYSEAAFCIAYLRDVRPVEHVGSDTVMFDFRRSEWFERGWTLQELLAPKCVIFLTQRFEILGRKSDSNYVVPSASLLLNGIIAEVTGIEESVLCGIKGWRKTVPREVKMAWAANRRTTKPEDAAYCLLGLFNVYTGMQYGEGYKNAMKRLEQEITRKEQEMDDDDEDEDEDEDFYIVPHNVATPTEFPFTQRVENDNLDAEEICSACGQLLIDPVTTVCSHSICETCMVADDKIHMTIVPITGEGDAEGLASSWNFELFNRCPACGERGGTVQGAPFAPPNKVLRRRLQTQRPALYAQRVHSLKQSREDVQTMTIHVGNWHKSDGPKRHQWTFFVRPSRTDMIDHVKLHLHDSFENPTVILKNAPFTFHAQGWGYFDIQVAICLKSSFSWQPSPDVEDGPNGDTRAVLKLNWMLDFHSFGGRGAMGRCFARFARRRRRPKGSTHAGDAVPDFVENRVLGTNSAQSPPWVNSNGLANANWVNSHGSTNALENESFGPQFA